MVRYHVSCTCSMLLTFSKGSSTIKLAQIFKVSLVSDLGTCWMTTYACEQPCSFVISMSLNFHFLLSERFVSERSPNARGVEGPSL